MEEWKQLQTIIGRYDTLEFQHRGWLLVLVGALIAALYADKGRLSGGLFAVVAGTVWALFLWMELVSRLTKRKALWRVRAVETCLRGEAPYDGPRLSLSLSFPAAVPEWRMMLREVRIALVWAFYGGLLAIILIFALTAPPRVP
jgi:hypothetical protein